MAKVTGYDVDMGRPFRYSVKFQIRHPSLTAAEVVARLPWRAVSSWTVGDRRQTPSGTLLDGFRSQTYCSFNVADGSDGELAACLLEAINTLWPHKDHLDMLRSGGGTLNFYVFWYPDGDTGETFDLELLRKLISLGVELGLNVYDDRAISA